MLIDRFLDERIPEIITPTDYRSQLIRRMHFAFTLVKENLKDSREKMKKEYDKRVKIQNYETGDKVLLDTKVIPMECNKKLTPKYNGPYRILEMHDNKTATIINDNLKQQRVHINRLKPLYETMLWKDEPMGTFEETPLQEEDHTTSEEEDSPPTSDNEEAEETPQLDQEETLATNDRTASRSRAGLRDRRSIHPPTKLDL